METLNEYLKSSAFYDSSVYITQTNDDNTRIFFELSYIANRKIYIKMMSSSKVNKVCDTIYECIYDQLDHEIRSPEDYPANPAKIIIECLTIMIYNKCAVQTYIAGVPSSVHKKDMRDKWFREVIYETFGRFLSKGGIKTIHMSI